MSDAGNDIILIDRNSNALFSYIEHEVIKNENVTESKTRKIVRPIFVSASILIISSGNIPWIDYSLQYGGRYNSEGLGITLAVGDSVSYVTYIVWGYFELVNNKLHAKSEAEKTLEKSNISKVYAYSTTTLSAVMSVFGSFTVAWMARWANRNSKAMPLWIHPTIIMLTSPISSFLSLQLTFKSLANLFLNNFEKSLLTTKDSLKNGLAALQQKVLLMEPTPRNAFLSSLASDNGHESTAESINLVIKKFFDHFPHKTPEANGSKVGHYISGGVGALMGLALLSHHWIGGCEAGKFIFQDDNACIPTASVTTACNAYLLLDTNIKTFQGIYSILSNAASGNMQPTPASTLYPIRTACLRIAGLACCSLGFAPTVIFSEDQFGNNPALAKTIAVTSTLGILGSAGLGVYSTIERIINASARRWGTRDEARLVEFCDKMDRLSGLLDSCSMLVFAQILRELRTLMGNEWATALDIPEESALASYLDTVQNPRIEEMIQPLILNSN